MKKEICISGFGGQGVMSIGKSLVEAGINEGIEVTWAPSYGPEMRGGTANCSVVLSDKPIGSPVFAHPSELIAMNTPSLEKFEPTVLAGGMIFVNSSVITEKVSRTDVKAIYVPCAEIAYKVGNPKVGNMVMLGAYIAATGALKQETIETMIHEMFTGSKAKLVPMNIEALKLGMACAG
ncbi:MAG: 2-oxoacid:acceptor oxidoreductase family protein [Oscillospiraceae bacterium]